MTRQQKINFLLQYQAGLKTIDDLKEREMIVIVKEGFYYPVGTTLILDEQEITEYMHGVEIVLYLPTNGREL